MYVYNIKQIAEKYSLNRRTAKKKSESLEKVYRINKRWKVIFVGYLIREQNG
jgi:hypothetical protein